MPLSISRFGWLKSARVVWSIGWSDFLLKYQGSMLGYLWSLISPLVKFTVILHVFRPFVGGSIPHYPLYLLLGLIIWEHFAATTTGCMTMLHEKAEIIRRLPFPRIILIFIVGWTQAVVFLTHFAIFCLFALAWGVRPGIGFVYMMPVMLQMSMLALGTGMMLSAYSLKFRDIGHMWVVGLQVLFWLTPVAYAYSPSSPFLSDLISSASAFGKLSLASLFDFFIRFQPLSVLVNDARRALLYPLTARIPSMLHAVGFTGLCLFVFAAGAIVYSRRSRYFIQEY